MSSNKLRFFTFFSLIATFSACAEILPVFPNDTCQAGTTEPCFCENGEQGERNCIEESSIWEECECPKLVSDGGNNGDSDSPYKGISSPHLPMDSDQDNSTEHCEPDCSGKKCGPDGCGGNCGICESPKVCTDEISGVVHPTYQCIDVTVGCSDGQREGFNDTWIYPTIASCAGSFAIQSLRTPRTGTWCGDDMASCPTPEDLCSPGWHICMKNGMPEDLTSRIPKSDCHNTVAGLGAFCAASDALGPFDNVGPSCNGPYNPPFDCTTQVCSPCCGIGTNQRNCCGLDGLWGTHETWVSGTSCRDCALCNAASPSSLNGVLCCRDPERT